MMDKDRVNKVEQVQCNSINVDESKLDADCTSPKVDVESSEIFDTTSEQDGTTSGNENDESEQEKCNKLSEFKDILLDQNNNLEKSISSVQVQSSVKPTTAIDSTVTYLDNYNSVQQNHRTTKKVSNETKRLICRRKRSHRRRYTNTIQFNNDNDHDGDIDHSNDEDNEQPSNSGNDFDNSTCYRTNDKIQLSSIKQLNIFDNRCKNKDKPTFLRFRVQKNKLLRDSASRVQQEHLSSQNNLLPSKRLSTNEGKTNHSNFLRRKEKLKVCNQKSSQFYNTPQCKSSKFGSIFNYLLASRMFQLSSFNKNDKKQVVHSSSSTTTGDEAPSDSNSSFKFNNRKISTIPKQDRSSSDCLLDLPGASGSNKYYNSRAVPKLRSKIKSSRHEGDLTYYRLKSTTVHKSHWQDVKRFGYLLIIIAITCLILWQIYQILLDEYNYLGAVKTQSKLGEYTKYAVSTDAKPCAKIGSALLAKGGSAVDAAVGTLICMGVVIPNSLGIGGGSLMIVYDAKTRQATVIDGREVAPDYATENMFANNSMAASRGPLSIGIPGELAASWKAHQMFGRLTWSELFDGSIEMAEQGVPTVEHLSYALRANSHSKYISPELAKIYTNPQTNEYFAEGELFAQKELANTLRKIRDNGYKEFYGGSTGQMFIEDLKKQGGNITFENLVNYEALVRKPLKFELDSDLNLFTTPIPGSGIVLSVIMRIMKEFGYYNNIKPQKSYKDANLYYHRLAEAFKFAYAQRAGLEDKPEDPLRVEKLIEKLSSSEFIKEVVKKIDNVTHNDDRYGGSEYFSEDHGTAHVSVLDSEGNAVAITSSVNLYFGSGLVSPSTGIIYNDVMDDFVSPNIINKFGLAPSKYNHIKPGRRPISSMAPSVFVDSDGKARLVIGASGGAKITTAIASVSIRNCFLGDDIKTSIDGPRIHHQYLPNQISYEYNFPKDMLHGLVERGHNISQIRDRSSVVMAIASERSGDKGSTSRMITANSDYRKGGTVEGL